MSDDTPRQLMRDIPMLDIDRERMRNEFEGFDDMTIEEFRQAALGRVNSLVDLMGQLSE